MRYRKEDDGMNHEYHTCPKFKRVASSEDIVKLDGVLMCRRCMKEIAEKAEMVKR